MPRLLASLALVALALAVPGCNRATAAAGGASAADFTLQGDDGRPWTLSAQRGHPVVLTFGFTHCDDTCPLTLAKLGKAAASLGPRANDLVVAFMTVDPQRDTAPVLHTYLRRFGGNARFVGLTGTPEQVFHAESSYHVWAERIPGKRGHDDYDEAHSSAIFFIDSSGNIASLHDMDDPEQTYARAMRTLIE